MCENYINRKIMCCMGHYGYSELQPLFLRNINQVMCGKCATGKMSCTYLLPTINTRQNGLLKEGDVFFSQIVVLILAPTTLCIAIGIAIGGKNILTFDNLNLSEMQNNSSVKFCIIWLQAIINQGGITIFLNLCIGFQHY